jgi:hypothetical protein
LTPNGHDEPQPAIRKVEFIRHGGPSHTQCSIRQAQAYEASVSDRQDQR